MLQSGIAVVDQPRRASEKGIERGIEQEVWRAISLPPCRKIART
jgi:hypothetical protein